MEITWFFILFVVLYSWHVIWEFVLDQLNLKNIEKNKNKIPKLYQSEVQAEDYQKSIEYTGTKTKFGHLTTLIDIAFLWIFILSGAFEKLDLFLQDQWGLSGLHLSVAYLLSFSLIVYLIALPSSLYSQFVIEEKFGFNKMSFGLWLTDQAKTLLVSALIGIPLLYLIFWLVQASGPLWWLYTWGVIMLFQIFMAALFPVFLMPLFYKFTPLEEGELKNRIEAVAQKINFKMSGIFTIDGSKRSGHSNAFFAGLGKTRRIVLYDTLVKSLNQDELISVLAHEMGHNVKKHIRNSLILGSLSTLIGLYVLSLLLNWQPFYSSFGVQNTQAHIGFLIFGFLNGVFTAPFTPLFKILSRKNEYEADAFSVEVTGQREPLISSLVKLSKDNLSNLTPHPWYSFWHYSHPTTIERANAIRSIAS